MEQDIISLSPNHLGRTFSSPVAGLISPTARSTGEIQKPFFIGVCGGPASGKTEVCDRITGKLSALAGDTVARLGQRVAVVNMDSFYKKLSPDEQLDAIAGVYNFDHPNAFDEDAMLEALCNIRDGIPVQLSTYDYVHNTANTKDSKIISNADVVLVEGILVFYYQKIRDMFHLKLFVETDAESRLVKRIMRDTIDHGRSLDKVLTQYLQSVKPSYEQYCLPTKKYADVIIPRGADNQIALDMIAEHINDILNGTVKRFQMAVVGGAHQMRPH